MGSAQALSEAFGFLTMAEVELLTKVSKELREDPVIVNIGAGAGTSGLTFVEARPDAVLYTVDIQERSSPHGSLEGERNAFINAGLGHLFGLSWFQIAGDSQQVAKPWRAESGLLADLIFIDADHTYESCAGDIQAWLPNLVMSGYLAIHDYDKATNDPREYGRNHPFPGVDAAVRDLLLDRGYPVVGQADCLIVFKKVKI